MASPAEDAYQQSAHACPAPLKAAYPSIRPQLGPEEIRAPTAAAPLKQMGPTTVAIHRVSMEATCAPVQSAASLLGYLPS